MEESFESWLTRIDGQTADEAPAIVERLLAHGRLIGASDLHLEPRQESLAIRLRLDGCLRTVGLLRCAWRGNLVQRAKILAGLPTYRSDIPQEGRIATDGHEARLSIMPTLFGEKAVVRFVALSKKDTQFQTLATLDSLKLPSKELSCLRAILSRPQGLLLLTGPAGSGKTTTLYSCLRFVMHSGLGERHIVTVEDPVESVLEGATQIETNAHSGLNFPTALRALLRQDPEVLMIGEIRDSETAQIAVQAALTGHLILATLHAASTVEVFLRLIELGAEPGLVASTVSAVLSQRLVRRLCEQCRIPTGNTEEPFAAMASGKGCAACHHTGFSGRELISELLTPGEAFRDAVRESASRHRLMGLAMEDGCHGLWPLALQRIKSGVTTTAEVRRVLAPSSGD